MTGKSFGEVAVIFRMHTSYFIFLCLHLRLLCANWYKPLTFHNNDFTYLYLYSSLKSLCAAAKQTNIHMVHMHVPFDLGMPLVDEAFWLLSLM